LAVVNRSTAGWEHARYGGKERFDFTVILWWFVVPAMGQARRFIYMYARREAVF